MYEFRLSDAKSLRSLSVEWDPLLPSIADICRHIGGTDSKAINKLRGTFSELLTLDRNSNWRTCPDYLVEPFLTLVRESAVRLCPEVAEQVVEVFRWRILHPKTFDIEQALASLNKHLQQQNEKAPVAPKASFDIIGPSSLVVRDTVDLADSSFRSDDELETPFECILRVGRAGGSEGFGLKASGIPGDAFELCFYFQNYYGPERDQLEVNIQLPDRVSYVPGTSYVRVREGQNDYDQPIPEENIVRIDQVLGYWFTPRSHQPGDAFFLHLQVRVGNHTQFVQGNTEMTCRAAALIADVSQISNPALIVVRKAKFREEAGSLDLCGWNERAPVKEWRGKTELLAVAGDLQRLRLRLTNQGTETLTDSHLELSCSHRMNFPESVEWYTTSSVEFASHPCEKTMHGCKIPVPPISPGTGDSKIFCLSAVLQEATSIVTVKARWLNGESVLSSDYIELRTIKVEK